MINMKGEKGKKQDELNFPSFTRDCDFKIQYVVNRFRVKIIIASGSRIKYNDKRLHIIRLLRNICLPRIFKTSSNLSECFLSSTIF